MDREEVIVGMSLVVMVFAPLAIFLTLYLVAHNTTQHNKKDQCKSIANDFHVSGELIGNNCILTSRTGAKQIVRVD